MPDFRIFVKTYPKDYRYLPRLFESLELHNLDRIPITVCDDRTNLASLAEVLSPYHSSVTVIATEDVIANPFRSAEIDGSPEVGYMNQMLVKLAWGLTTQNFDYLCVDSDAKFIRDFRTEDFYASNGLPFRYIEDDRPLYEQDQYWFDHGQGREHALGRICSFFEIRRQEMLLIHGFQVIRSEEVRGLDAYLQSRGHSLKSAVGSFRNEFGLHSAYLTKVGSERCLQLSPFKTIHNQDHLVAQFLSCESEASVSRSYLAVIYNSNFSRAWGEIGFESWKRFPTSTRYHKKLRKVFFRRWANRFGPRRILRTINYLLRDP